MRGVKVGGRWYSRAEQCLLRRSSTPLKRLPRDVLSLDAENATSRFGTRHKYQREARDISQESFFGVSADLGFRCKVQRFRVESNHIMSPARRVVRHRQLCVRVVSAVYSS